MKLGIRVSKSNPHFIPDLGAGTCQVNKIGYHFHETGYLFSSEAAAAAAVPPSQQLLKKVRDLKPKFFSDSSWTKKTNTPILSHDNNQLCPPIIFLLLPLSFGGILMSGCWVPGLPWGYN
jgi:hypothetical protein